VDVVVQSTDKNFMVPVGGSFMVARKGCEGLLLDRVNTLYPGRASMGPTMDVLMTLLHLGESGWRAALGRRDGVKARLEAKLKETCVAMGETPILVPGNDISFGMTLDSFGDNASFLGAMLFKRCASGARVLVNSGKETTVAGVTFRNFGQSHDAYPHSYLTVAAALGMKEEEVDEFFDRLCACAKEYLKRKSKDG
jgi:O-phospho-L-seryl-tRNASec:L-selenocysteinyl-tRNA synthase